MAKRKGRGGNVLKGKFGGGGGFSSPAQRKAVMAILNKGKGGSVHAFQGRPKVLTADELASLPSHARGGGLRGYIDASYGEIRKRLGKPTRTGSDKVQVEWVFRLPGGRHGWVYDYKNPDNPEKNTDWHVGGLGDDALTAMQRLFGKKRTSATRDEFNAKRGIITPRFISLRDLVKKMSSKERSNFFSEHPDLLDKFDDILDGLGPKKSPPKKRR